MGLFFFSPLTTLLIILFLALGTFLVCALSSYKGVARVMGRPWVATIVGSLALAALIIHVQPHYQELISALFPGGLPTFYLLGAFPFVLIALFGFWVESLYHSHEHEAEHAAHTSEIERASFFSSITRLLVLGLHAFLDGHVMAELGLSWLVLPFLFHKGVDGLVVNGERTTHRQTSAWRWRIVIQIIATSSGAFLRLEGVPELIHIGLVSAVIGLYTGALMEYIRQRGAKQLELAD